MKAVKFRVIFLLLFVSVLAACSGNKVTNEKSNDANDSKGTNDPNLKQTTIVFSTWSAPTYYLNEGYVIPWMDAVEEKTNGEITFEQNYGGVLGSAQSHLDDLNAGIFDTTHGLPSYFKDTDTFKLSIFELPFAIGAPSEEAAKVVSEYWEIHGKDAWGENIVSAAPYQSDSYVIFSKEPINTFEDLKGKKISVSNDSWFPVVEEWGATPLKLTLADIYSNLEKGTLDAAVYSKRGGLSLSLPEVAPYVLNFPMSTFTMMPLITVEALDKMDASMKKTFKEELLPLQTEIYNEFILKDLEDSWAEIEVALKEHGGEITQLSEEEKQKFLETAKPAWEAWVKEANVKGYDGDQMMEDFRRLSEEFELKLPF